MQNQVIGITTLQRSEKERIKSENFNPGRLENPTFAPLLKENCK